MKKLLLCSLVLLSAFALGATAQNHRPKKTPKPEPRPSASANVQPTPAGPAKRNGRPGAAAQIPATDKQAFEPDYRYEFSRPGFTYSPIVIEHDAAGRGRISFTRDGYDEPFTDPLQLTTVTLGKIDDALKALDYLNSSEVYQTARDYSTMGNTTFTYRSGGRERTVKYNWTENKHAKALMDEYRHIGNEYTWRFQMSLARENQPLETPALMDQIDSYLTRGEISDPANLVQFLTELSNDERLPLLARNRASKLIARIAKAGK